MSEGGLKLKGRALRKFLHYRRKHALICYHCHIKDIRTWLHDNRIELYATNRALHNACYRVFYNDLINKPQKDLEQGDFISSNTQIRPIIANEIYNFKRLLSKHGVYLDDSRWLTFYSNVVTEPEMVKQRRDKERLETFIRETLSKLEPIELSEIPEPIPLSDLMIITESDLEFVEDEITKPVEIEVITID